MTILYEDPCDYAKWDNIYAMIKYNLRALYDVYFTTNRMILPATVRSVRCFVIMRLCTVPGED